MGMSDDHLNVAVAADGTLYAAVKTGYDSSSQPKIAFLVRRPNGSWDDLYEVDSSGTRPIVLLPALGEALGLAEGGQVVEDLGRPAAGHLLPQVGGTGEVRLGSAFRFPARVQTAQRLQHPADPQCLARGFADRDLAQEELFRVAVQPAALGQTPELVQGRLRYSRHPLPSRMISCGHRG